MARSKKKQKNLIGVEVIGSSHTTRRHHFEPSLKAHLMDPKHLWYYQRFRYPSFNGEGGRMLSQFPREKCISVSEIIQFLTDQKDRKLALILQVATNNFRLKLHSNSENIAADPESVAHLFQQIVDYAVTLPNIHLILVGMIPDPQNDAALKDKFLDLNQRLEKMSIENSSTATFLNVDNIFSHMVPMFIIQLSA